MRIENHLLGGIMLQRAGSIGGVITPELVVLHDTASRLEHGSAASYLANNRAGVCVHFVIERDGSVVQQSTFHGRDGCNEFSIGIEIVNPGLMARASATHARAWYGQLFDIGDYGIEELETREHGRGLWMAYTEAQIDAVTALLEVLFRDVPTLTDIRTHWYVSPGRKIDTSPLFPLEHIRARSTAGGALGVLVDAMFARGGVPDGETEMRGASPAPVTAAGGGLGVLATSADGREGVLPMQRTAGGALGVLVNAMFARGGVPDGETDMRGASPAPAATAGIAWLTEELRIIRDAPVPDAAAPATGLLHQVLPDRRAPAATVPWRSALMDGPGISFAPSRAPQGRGGRDAEAPYAVAVEMLAASGASGAATPKIEIVNKAEGFEAKEGATRTEGGNQIMEVIIARVEEAMAGNVMRGSGPLTAALAGSFGLARQGR